MRLRGTQHSPSACLDSMLDNQLVAGGHKGGHDASEPQERGQWVLTQSVQLSAGVRVDCPGCEQRLPYPAGTGQRPTKEGTSEQ